MNDKYVVELKKRGAEQQRNVQEMSKPTHIVRANKTNNPKKEVVEKKHHATSARPIAIHLTDTTLYILQLGEGGSIVYTDSTLLPEGSVARGQIQDVEKVAQTLQHLLAQHTQQFQEHTPLRGAVCIPKSQSYIQHFILPETKERNIDTVVQETLQNIVPFSFENVCVDYVTRTIGKETHVVSVTVPKSVVYTYIEVLEQSGITPVLVDVEAAALGVSLIPKETKEGSLIIDIGLRSTALSVYNGQELVTSLFTPTGFETMSQALTETSTDTQSPYKDVASTLVQSVHLLLQQFEQSHPTIHIKKIYLAGRGAHFTGLDTFIQQDTGIQTGIGKPTQNTDMVDFAVTYGLALRAENKDTPGFSLPTKKDMKETKKIRLQNITTYLRNNKHIVLGIGVGVTVFLLGVAYILFTGDSLENV